MRFLIAILIAASLEGVTADNAKEFFQSVYNPQVHYDGDGNVLMEGCPLTAGHIEPDWSATVCETVGKGKKSRVEFHVPISVEREIWTLLSDDHERYPVKELAECELVLSCKKKDSIMLWDAAVRYRIADPVAAGNRKVSGLVVEVDPNTFTTLSLKAYQNGNVVLEEDNLEGYRWVYKKVYVGLTKKEEFNKTFNPGPVRIPLISLLEGYYVSIPAKNTMSAAFAQKASYEPVISSPAIHNALKRYRYFPVTVK